MSLFGHIKVGAYTHRPVTYGVPKNKERSCCSLPPKVHTESSSNSIILEPIIEIK